MLLIALAALLVMGIVYFQVAQGLYGALIMTILTILCATMAFNFYEQLAEAVLYERQPAYADAASLLVLFVIPLLVLRLVTDRLLPSNVVLGVWVDRIGGGVLGLVTAQILVGVLLIAVQMLPLGESILGYTSHAPSLQRDQRMMPFFPDEFTIELMDVLSRTGLRGDTSFTSTHDDLLGELFCARNTAGKDGRIDAMPGHLQKVQAFTPTGEPPCELPENPLLDSADLPRTVIVRVTVDVDARGEKSNWLRLPATHFRLITTAGKDRTAITSYYPVGFLTAWRTNRMRNPTRKGALEPRKQSDSWQCQYVESTDRQVQPANVIVERRRWGQAKTITVDWVYQIRENDKPLELVFRRTSRKAIKTVSEGWPAREGALARVDDSSGSRRRRR